MKRTHSVVAILFSGLLGSCEGSNPVSPQVGIAGDWAGTISRSANNGEQIFTLALAETAGTVSGTALVWSANATVTGTYSESSGLTATITQPGRSAMTFYATFVPPNSMAGSILGGGFGGEAATLVKPCDAACLHWRRP